MLVTTQLTLTCQGQHYWQLRIPEEHVHYRVNVLQERSVVYVPTSSGLLVLHKLTTNTTQTSISLVWLAIKYEKKWIGIEVSNKFWQLVNENCFNHCLSQLLYTGEGWSRTIGCPTVMVSVMRVSLMSKIHKIGGEDKYTWNGQMFRCEFYCRM